MRLSEQFIGVPVLSVHAGQAIARTASLLIDPHRLVVAALFCQLTRSNEQRVVLPQNIREAGREGLVINHEEDLAEMEELIRLKDVVDLNYQLVGKSVVTESKQKLGRVSNFVIDDRNWTIIKLHVARPAWRAMFDSALIIDRSMIVSVSQRAIVVKDASVKAAEAETAPAAIPTPAA